MFPVCFTQQGAIPLPSGGLPTKRPLGGRAANVPAELLCNLFSFWFASEAAFKMQPPHCDFFEPEQHKKS